MGWGVGGGVFTFLIGNGRGLAVVYIEGLGLSGEGVCGEGRREVCHGVGARS